MSISYPYRFYYISEYLCVYCGDDAKLYDHVLPLRYFRALPYPHLWHPSLLTLVPACYSCNARARDRLFATLEDKLLMIRTEILRDNIRRERYRARQRQLSA
jgi:5-methylcytosine-specific restriction endonuclease McrA